MDTISRSGKNNEQYTPEIEEQAKKLLEAAQSSELLSMLIEDYEEQDGVELLIEDVRGDELSPAMQLITRRRTKREEEVEPEHINLALHPEILQEALLGYTDEIASWETTAEEGSCTQLSVEISEGPWTEVHEVSNSRRVREVETSSVRLEFERASDAPLGFWARKATPEFISLSIKDTGRDLRADPSYQTELKHWLIGESYKCAEQLVYYECLLNPALTTEVYLHDFWYSEQDFDSYLSFKVPVDIPEGVCPVGRPVERRIFLLERGELCLLEAELGAFQSLTNEELASIVLGRNATSKFSKLLTVERGDEEGKAELLELCPNVAQFALEARDRVDELYEARRFLRDVADPTRTS